MSEQHSSGAGPSVPVESGGTPSEGSSDALSWTALPRRIRFSLAKDGAQPDPAILATLFSGEKDISSFLEKAGFCAGSVEWIHSLQILLHYTGSASDGASRLWRSRAMQGIAQIRQPESAWDHACVAPPSQEWLATKSGAKRLLLRWSTRRERDLSLASEVQTRAKVETAELSRWRKQLVALLKECRMPVCGHAVFATDPEKVLLTSSGNLRSSALRARIREWIKFSLWCNATEAKPFPSHVGLLIDYIEELREQPCSRTRLKSVLSAVAFFERAGGIRKEVSFSSQPIVLNLVNVRTAELEVGAPPTRRAVPFPIILVISLELLVASAEFPKYLRAYAWIKLFKFWTSSRSDDLQGASFDSMVFSELGLRGYFDRTKTSGAGRKVRFLPFFISAEAWLANPRWLEQGLMIWKGAEFSFKRDFLVPRPTRNLCACRPVLASYNDLATASRLLLTTLKMPAFRGDAWSLSEEPLFSNDELLRVFTEHSERGCMATLAAWAGIDRERRDYLGRWHIVESADVYVRSAWKVVTSLQAYILNALVMSVELCKVGLSEIQERLQDHGIEADRARQFAEGLQVPSEWAAWRRAFCKSQPVLPVLEKSAAPPEEPRQEQNFRFYISVLGKRALRRLHRRGGCGTKPGDLLRCEFYENLDGVEYDAECKHCFRPEQGATSMEEAAGCSAEESSSTSLDEGSTSSDGP